MTATWKTIKTIDGWLYEEMVGGPEWDGFRCFSINPLPGTPPPAAHEDETLPRARPMVTSADCIPTCSVAESHERWECELLATTDEEWERLLR